jgi:hypothetical protein
MTRTLADTITPREREHLELCIHEAAHAVAGVVLGAELRNAVVVQSKVLGTQGLTTFEPDMPPGAELQAAYAGPYGQARFRAGGRRPTQQEMFALWEGAGCGDFRTLVASGGSHLGARITPLLERCWPAVVRVAQQLHKVGEVFQSDVLAALGVDDGGGRTSVQLNSIRLGWGRQVPPLTTAKRAVPA